MQVAEQQVILAQQIEVCVPRLLDLDDHLCAPIPLARCRQDLCADVAIVLVGVAAFFTCACFHENLVPSAHELGTGRRNQTYAALARLEFARNTNSHVMAPWSLCRTGRFTYH